MERRISLRRRNHERGKVAGSVCSTNGRPSCRVTKRGGRGGEGERERERERERCNKLILFTELEDPVTHMLETLTTTWTDQNQNLNQDEVVKRLREQSCPPLHPTKLTKQCTTTRKSWLHRRCLGLIPPTWPPMEMLYVCLHAV